MLVLTAATQPTNEMGAAMQCNYHCYKDPSFLSKTEALFNEFFWPQASTIDLGLEDESYLVQFCPIAQLPWGLEMVALVGLTVDSRASLFLLSNILCSWNYDPCFRVERLILRGKDVDVAATPSGEHWRVYKNTSHLWVSLHQVSRLWYLESPPAWTSWGAPMLNL